MKKTLTINLGGIVYHIDDDAYRLLDNYLTIGRHRHLYDRQFLLNLWSMSFSFLFLLFRIIYWLYDSLFH